MPDIRVILILNGQIGVICYFQLLHAVEYVLNLFFLDSLVCHAAKKRPNANKLREGYTRVNHHLPRSGFFGFFFHTYGVYTVKFERVKISKPVFKGRL